jgi:hypothetical protein
MDTAATPMYECKISPERAIAQEIFQLPTWISQATPREPTAVGPRGMVLVPTAHCLRSRMR